MKINPTEPIPSPRPAEGVGAFVGDLTPENVITWAEHNHDQLAFYRKKARNRTIRSIVSDVGATSPEERLAVFRALMQDEYVLIGKVHVAAAKAYEFPNKDGKAIRELIALQELAEIGYEVFLFREKFARHAAGYYANPDGSIGVRFIDVKHARTLGSIQTAINKGVRQGEGTVLVYAGREKHRVVINRTIENLTAKRTIHYVFLKMANYRSVLRNKWFIKKHRRRSLQRRPSVAGCSRTCRVAGPSTR